MSSFERRFEWLKFYIDIGCFTVCFFASAYQILRKLEQLQRTSLKRELMSRVKGRD